MAADEKAEASLQNDSGVKDDSTGQITANDNIMVQDGYNHQQPQINNCDADPTIITANTTHNNLGDNGNHSNNSTTLESKDASNDTSTGQ